MSSKQSKFDFRAIQPAKSGKNMQSFISQQNIKFKTGSKRQSLEPPKAPNIDINSGPSMGRTQQNSAFFRANMASSLTEENTPIVTTKYANIPKKLKTNFNSTAQSKW